MAERPIIFSTPMVKALLVGTKTQTRRLVGPSSCTVLGEHFPKKLWAGLRLYHPETTLRTQSLFMNDLHLSVPWLHPKDEANGLRWEDDGSMYRVRPIWQAGDRLWVRETWHLAHHHAEYPELYQLYYRAGGARVIFNDDCRWAAARALTRRWHDTWTETKGWRSPIHMPRWTSRLTLTVTDVRVQRLGDISAEDAVAEGARERFGVGASTSPPDILDVESFAALWSSIHGPGAWERNEYVVALTFEVRQGNIDDG